MYQFDLPCNFYKSVFKTTCTVNELRSRKALNTSFMIILEICQKQHFDIIAMTPRGTLGLCCVHIAQLVTHLSVYTLSFTLQLCYKPLGILQRVIKVKKFIYQIMMYCKNFTTLTFLDIGPKVFSGSGQRNENFLFPPLIFLKTIKNPFPEI